MKYVGIIELPVFFFVTQTLYSISMEWKIRWCKRTKKL